MRITVLGQPAIILSSLKAANDLLETRGVFAQWSLLSFFDVELQGIYTLIVHPRSWLENCMYCFTWLRPQLLPIILHPHSVGWNRGLGYSQASHNPRFREFRRLFHQFIGPRACADPSLIELQEQENQRSVTCSPV